jgi:hypothetical protein
MPVPTIASVVPISDAAKAADAAVSNPTTLDAPIADSAINAPSVISAAVPINPNDSPAKTIASPIAKYSNGSAILYILLD